MSDPTKSGASESSGSAWEETKDDLASGWKNIKDRTEETIDEISRDHESTAEEFGVDDDQHRKPAESRRDA